MDTEMIVASLAPKSWPWRSFHPVSPSIGFYHGALPRVAPGDSARQVLSVCGARVQGSLWLWE